MTLPRPGSLRMAILCLLPLWLGLSPLGQLHAQQNQPAPQPPKPAKPNPFETVPVAPAEPKPEAPKPEAPKAPVQAASPDRPPEDIVEAIDFRGARRVPQDTLRAMIFTKRGDKYDDDALHRDFMALWNTGQFDDIKIEREPGEK